RPRVTTHHRVLLVRFVLSVPVSRDHRDLHPFPTRRSSDLARCLPARGRGQDAAHLAPSDEHVVGPLEFRRDARRGAQRLLQRRRDRKSTRLNSSHVKTSYAVFCLKKKKPNTTQQNR